jgi:hypothetical protein
MNGYALGRIVAGDAIAARFISARKSSHYRKSSLRIQTPVAIASHVMLLVMDDPAVKLRPSQDWA